MGHRLLDRLWDRIVDRYDDEDGGDCGCGTVLDDAGEDAQAPDPDAVENSKRESKR